MVLGVRLLGASRSAVSITVQRGSGAQHALVIYRAPVRVNRRRIRRAIASQASSRGAMVTLSADDGSTLHGSVPAPKDAGIGVTLRCEGSTVEVIGVARGGGADRAGLAVGDCILKVDSIPAITEGIPVRDRLRGQSGTVVKITVSRAGAILDFVVRRIGDGKQSARKRVASQGSRRF